jgi:hypothetical protein
LALVAGAIACRSGVARTSSDVTGVVKGFAPSVTSSISYGLVLEFSNHTTRPITIYGYKVVWLRGEKMVSGVDVRVEAGATRTRTVDVGYVENLKIADTRVEIMDWR